MARLIFVHGAFAGAWKWARVVEPLEAAGHTAEALDLPGSGEDRTPVGEVTLAGAAGARASMSGEQVFQAVCKTCHEAGIAGSPKAGDKAAWAASIKKGYGTLLQHALNGFQEQGKDRERDGDTGGDGTAHDLDLCDAMRRRYGRRRRDRVPISGGRRYVGGAHGKDSRPSGRRAEECLPPDCREASTPDRRRVNPGAATYSLYRRAST